VSPATLAGLPRWDKVDPKRTGELTRSGGTVMAKNETKVVAELSNAELEQVTGGKKTSAGGSFFFRQSK
jgi:bacteriocin-like protein